MGFDRRAVLGVAALVAAVPLLLQGQQPPTFKSGTKVVSLYTTVTDNGRLVPGLAREDFEVLDDDKPQPITVFSNEVQTITVVTMLDTSGSQSDNIKLLQAAAEQFFLRMLPGDRAQVGDFNDKIQLLSAMTGDRDELIASLQDIDFGYPTRLYDAIVTGIDELKGVEGRRVVLVLTDGDDTYSKVSFGTVLDRALANEVMVYTIGLEGKEVIRGRAVWTKPDRSLRKLAEVTGGGYFLLDRADQLTSSFTRVSEELHSQYLLGFSPAVRDGKEHKLEVRVKRPGLKARTRKSYVAS
jgi:Ca-activated chloride channel family protein